MTPDRLQEIRQRLDATHYAHEIASVRLDDPFTGHEAFTGRPFNAQQAADNAEFIAHAPRDITDLLAALATAEAEGRQKIRQAINLTIRCCAAAEFPDGNHDWDVPVESIVRQLLPETPHP